MLFSWIINITDEIEMSKWDLLINEVDEERRESISKYKFISDKKRALIAGLLIRAMLKEIVPEYYNAINFFKNNYGKPYIKGVPELYFNISHSGDYVCCAVSDEEVGIDVERINLSIDIRNFKTFFPEEEWCQIISKSKNSIDNFFSLWTLKESYVKKIGKGLSKNLNSFCIYLEDPIVVVDNNEKKENEKFILRKLNDSHKFAICSRKCSEIVEKEMSVEDFIDKYY
ncbi:hypothetical protein A5881_003601 [Enterococcus termitis]